jgi:hypothetical protein
VYVYASNATVIEFCIAPPPTKNGVDGFGKGGGAVVSNGSDTTPTAVRFSFSFADVVEATDTRKT